MPVKFEIKAKTGEDKSGKAFYTKIGVVLQGDKGFTMKLNTLPLNWDGFAFFSEPEQRQQGGGQQQQRAAPRQQQNNGYGAPQQGKGSGFEEMDDDIPF